ncbi:mycofactocin precursor MftA [Streptomyces griseosporeus]|jgi:mycofactocin precursor
MNEEQLRYEPDTINHADDLVEEVLVEEVSIDGMCGVY